MKVINYTAKVLPDGHLSLPEDIKKEMGLIVNSTVKITLEKKKFARMRLSGLLGSGPKEPTLKTGPNILRK
ncbi:MAG: hypothetical protein C5S41_05535 [Candidatus Methanomarinus sp.]|nr:MAG: hypothetical protein C5S41_05535 [ANME-2 cluster archaeon]